MGVLFAPIWPVQTMPNAAHPKSPTIRQFSHAPNRSRLPSRSNQLRNIDVKHPVPIVPHGGSLSAPCPSPATRIYEPLPAIVAIVAFCPYFQHPA